MNLKHLRDDEEQTGVNIKQVDKRLSVKTFRVEQMIEDFFFVFKNEINLKISLKTKLKLF